MDIIKTLDVLQGKVRDKEITVKDAVNQIAVFIQTDFRLFGMGKCNEDERSSITLEFLDTGNKVFERYREDYGSFHNYLQSFVKGIVQTQMKRSAVSCIKDQVNYFQSIDDYIDVQEDHEFTMMLENNVSVPYSYKTPSPVKNNRKILVKEFMQRRNAKENAKLTIVLALKACYDLTDYEIKIICTEHNLDEDDFYDTVQKVKETMLDKIKKRNTILSTRNAAFYNHRRFSPDLTSYDHATDRQKSVYENKFSINTERWLKKNNQLAKGKYHLSPTNKIIAQTLGICVRQINYYISQAKKTLKEKNCNLK